MSKQNRIDQYAVIGHPIKHSKSPQIHTLFAQQVAEKMCYNTLLSPLNNFKTTVLNFRQQGGKGLNVTVPFKQQAWQLSDTCSDHAKVAQAVNTLIFQKNGKIHGDNTDGIGLVRDLTQNHGFNLNHKRILILGAGGAVRGILSPIMAQKPSSVLIANRTISKAIHLVKETTKEITISGGGFDKITGTYDLIINGTSSSLHGVIPPIPENCLAKKAVCYDMMYAEKPTLFVQWGQQNGAKKSLDGLGMLIEQAAESFFLWRKIKVNTPPIFRKLRPISFSN